MKEFRVFNPQWIITFALFLLLGGCGEQASFTDSLGSIEDLDQIVAQENPKNGDSPRPDDIVGDEIPEEIISPEDITGTNPHGPIGGNPNGEPGTHPQLPPGTIGNIPELEIPTNKKPDVNNPDALVTQLFQSTVTGKSLTSIDLSAESFTQQLEMLRNYSQKIVRYQQDANIQVTDTFQQGSVGTPQTESFRQEEKGRLDLLVNIDNSGSMREEQLQLAEKFNTLISHLDGFDWQIAINTTDTKDSCVRDLIRKGEANVEQRFAAAVTAGITGSPLERGLYQSIRALEGNCWVGNWVRPDSVVAIIGVTDEDECSSRDECPYAGEASADNLLNYLSSIRTLGVSARMYGIFWHPSQGQSECSTAYKKAHSYADAVDATGGTWGSICDSSYESTITQMSRDMAKLLKSQFTLANTPDSGSLQVRVNGQIVQNYTVAGKIIFFNQAPVHGAEISVSYTTGAASLQNNFKLSEVVVGDIVRVSINGQTINPSNYSYNPADNKISMVVPPFSTVRVQYEKDSNLSKSFDLKGTVAQNSLKVYENNTLVSSSRYTINSAKTAITFNTAPVANSAVRVEYSEAGTPILSYPLLIDGQVTSVRKVGSNQEMRFYSSAGEIVIDGQDWQEGTQMLVETNTDKFSGKRFKLKHLPIAGTTKVRIGNQVCDSSKLKFDQGEIDFSECVGDSDRAVISYKYIVSHTSKFDFDGQLLSAIQGGINWTVYVNGVKSNAFNQNGLSFSFINNLDLGSIVAIEAKSTN